MEELEKGYNEWVSGYQESLSRYPERKEFKNLSGISLKPLYTPLDLEGFDYLEKLSFPCEYPFTRGDYPGMYRTQLWSKRQLGGYELPQTFNRRQKELLAAGGTAINLVNCNAYYRGYDSDQVEPELVGRCGVPINVIEDEVAIFDGIPLDSISCAFNDMGPFSMVAMFFALAEERGIPLSRLRGTTNQGDFISHFVACNLPCRFSLEGHLRLTVDHIKFCVEKVPGWNPMSIAGQHMQQAGATPVQALAFVLSSGIFYVDQCIKAGLDVDSFAPKFTFFLDAGVTLFEEVAKFRAGRRMWAKILKERFGAKDPSSMRFKFHGQTSGAQLTVEQPLNNLARGTIQALGAILGGCQSLHIDGFDEAYQSPTEEAMRMSIMTQNIIAEESDIADVVDPLGGSYYVESLTDEIEERAWDYINRIDGMGGMLEAVKRGWIQAEIGRSAWEFQKAVDSGERVVVGVNKHVFPEEPVKPRRLTTDMDAVKKYVQWLRDYKVNRDQRKVAAALANLREAALDERANVFAAVIDAFRAGVSNGEAIELLRGVFGRERPLVTV